MHREPDFLHNLRQEFADGWRWVERAIVLAYAAAAGLFVVAFTVLGEWAFARFEQVLHWQGGWGVLLWTPALTAAIVWATRRFVPGAAGSGIPQVMAALEPGLPPGQRGYFVSLRMSLGKVLLGSAGFLAGLSMGREGPSVQVAAGVMQHAQRWLGPRSGITSHALLVAGGAAGIAAAFNAPLAGVVFAIEELSRKLESRSSGLIIAAIVLAGLMGVSFFGNLTYFGVIRVPRLGWDALLPGLGVALVCGVLGGLFAKLITASLTGAPGRLNQWRARFPVRFAAAGGLAVAVIGLATGGATFGAGSEAVKHMLAGQADVPAFYVTLKFIATWLTAWCGVPGGFFAPALSIGAGVGHNISLLTGADIAPALIAMGMAAFLAAVTQAPLTAFIIVMEMVDGHAMVLSLMASAMLASLVSRMLVRPLYETLAEHLLHKVGAGPAAPADASPR
ncbi:chloride channel protein [Acidovorax sp. SUPP950]|uniref:chloride channel protein n=1 Tax=unclassified Acidovorax TaxID=2684926 RepID=UPI0023D3F533|nr:MULTISPECIES: chloride channel protein [Comamonadaceae]WOI46236.1 chloride channel protein [Paracidovorax avenae]GKS76296.1 chloride channel protein [Acidovorax sp. SUPP950]